MRSPSRRRSRARAASLPALGVTAFALAAALTSPHEAPAQNLVIIPPTPTPMPTPPPTPKPPPAQKAKAKPRASSKAAAKAPTKAAGEPAQAPLKESAGVSVNTPPATTQQSEEKDESGSTLRDLLHSWSSWLPGVGDETDADGDSVPAAMESDASDLTTPDELLSVEELRTARPWQQTDFSIQTSALGWRGGVFEKPRGFDARVAFWLDIYTKYTSDQGLLHDRDHFEIVYETIDFAPIMSDESTNIYQKARLREKLVNQRRKDLAARLLRLQSHSGPDGLGADDLRLWKLIEPLREKDKFKQAAQDGRIRFQLGQRDRFIVGIYHSGRYLREMEQIFRREKLPIELTRIPFVESSFNVHARSKVGASGVWQFMRRSAKPQLKVTNDVDERNDPLKATLASARLLRQNFQLLQSWPLAVTAYNHGASGINRIVKKIGSRDLADIVARYSSKRFGFASENFYACFLAALEAERNANTYFGDVKWGPPIEFSEIRLKRPLAYKTVLDFFDGDKDTAELANPHFLSRIRKGRALIPAGSYVRVPPSRQKLASDFLSGKLNAIKLALSLKEKPWIASAPTPTTPQAPPPVAPAISESAANPPPEPAAASTGVSANGVVSTSSASGGSATANPPGLIPAILPSASETAKP